MSEIREVQTSTDVDLGCRHTDLVPWGRIHSPPLLAERRPPAFIDVLCPRSARTDVLGGLRVLVVEIAPVPIIPTLLCESIFEPSAALYM